MVFVPTNFDLHSPKGSLDPQFARVLTLTSRVTWTEPTCSSWFGAEFGSPLGRTHASWFHPRSAHSAPSQCSAMRGP